MDDGVFRVRCRNCGNMVAYNIMHNCYDENKRIMNRFNPVPCEDLYDLLNKEINKEIDEEELKKLIKLLELDDK